MEVVRARRVGRAVAVVVVRARRSVVRIAQSIVDGEDER